MCVKSYFSQASCAVPSDSILLDDDAFITNYVGSLSGVSQMVSRFVYGLLFDFAPFKPLVGFQAILLAADVALLYTLSAASRASYVIAFHIVFLTFPGAFTIFPGTDILKN